MPLRASVTALVTPDGSPASPGAPASILVDGAETAVTANGLTDYEPTAGDRLLVQRVGHQIEILQFLSRGTVPYASNLDLSLLEGRVDTAETDIDAAESDILDLYGDVATAQTTADSAMTLANGKNKRTDSTSAPGSTPNTAGDTWYQHSGTVTGPIIGAWRGAGGTTWQPQSLDPVMIPIIDIGAGTFGTLSGTRITAASIEVDRLLVGVGANVAANPGFESGSLSPHVAPAFVTTALCSAIAPQNGQYSARLTCSATTVDAIALWINGTGVGTRTPAVLGEEWLAEAWMRIGSVTGTPKGRVYIYEYDAAGALLRGSAGNYVTLTSGYQYVTHSREIVHADTAFIRMAVAVDDSNAGDIVFVDDLVFKEKITGDLLVNGAIDGKTITGALIRSGASGARVEIENQSGDFGAFGMQTFYSDSAAWDPAVIWNQFIDSTTDFSYLAMQGPMVTGSTEGPPQIQLTSNSVSSGASALRQVGLVSKSILFKSNYITLDPSDTAAVEFRLLNSNILNFQQSVGTSRLGLDFDTAGRVDLRARTTSGGSQVLGLNGDAIKFLVVGSVDSEIQNGGFGPSFTRSDVGSAVTLSGSEVQVRKVDGNYTAIRASSFPTSSDAHWKTNILALGPARSLGFVKDLKPRSWTWQNNDRAGEPGVGFVAQDVKALIPLAVSGRAISEGRDEDGEEPSGLGIDSLSLLAILWSATQNVIARVEALEAS